MHGCKAAISAAVGTAALLMTLAGAAAFDETKYPDWSGTWKRAPGAGIGWDESKPRGRAQQPPLTPEYQAIWEASMADQAAGRQGGDTRVTCISNGMPRLMTVIRPIEFVVLPAITYVVYENNLPRRIYTDGKGFPPDNEPSYAGYSVGTWLDTDGDGRYDTLEVETRDFKGPRNYEDSGLPLHLDNQSIVKERLSLDKANPDVLKNEITVIDHALTRPWTVTKNYKREVKEVTWEENNCVEGNTYVTIDKQVYFRAADGRLMPSGKDQPPPDLRYFKQTAK